MICRNLIYLLLLPQCFVIAQSEFDPLGESELGNMEKQIRIQAEWIEVKHETMTDLLSKDRRVQPEGKLSSNDKHLRDELTDLIKEGQAKIAETIIVIARSGNRAKAEAIQEFIYPTEYDPQEPLVKGKDKGNSSTATNPTAAAFETRNVGATLEVDPVLGADNHTIDLNLAPELVYNTGFESYGEFENGGNKNEVKMPKFYAAKITTQVTVIEGEYLMIGAISPRDLETGEADSSRKLLLFIKCDILYTGLPIQKKRD